ncbi:MULTISPECIES: lipoyl protein ligase domain-containing protein [Micrococcales]|uniref:lipoyl protein ligase domain-containing protein n=1 Tax=Micrococcales TaxID=85006 RepID=UPI00068E6AE7|nr:MULTISPECIES: lipoate--protein ligase family protein [Micrococcales]
MVIERAEADASVTFESTVDRLRRVAAGSEESVLRFSRPAPVVGFGRRDELNPGFARAVRACAEHGFAASVRKVGGRAAAYHGDCLIIDHLVADADATSGNMRRYREFGRLYAEALGDLGLHAAVGEIPLEYCPGEYSVHGLVAGDHRIKLVGTAQRVVAGGWWFSAGIVVRRPEPLRAVLTEVYAHLRLPLDPSTVGSVDQAVPEVRCEDVEDAVQERYERWARETPVRGTRRA